MKRLIFTPHNLGSKGARSLASSVNGKCSKATKMFKRDVVLVNWGRSDLQIRGRPSYVLNKPDRVHVATNKLSCLNVLSQAGVCCVEHTTNIDIVKLWLKQGFVVYGRRVLNSSQGNGIVIITNVNEIISCPMYTKGIVKAHEYRVHVFRNKILDVTKKRRRIESESNDYVKNLNNGWVYCRDNINTPQNLLHCATCSINALGLDFGAVDILYYQNQPYVLEINTAPGLEGTTLNKYIEEFNKLRYV